uniref:Uncharacterized protein n=1 Tax=Sphaerodactylus townsendi TaxID=933632 RepID=A0ACB8FIB7_9SAUR
MPADDRHQRLNLRDFAGCRFSQESSKPARRVKGACAGHGFYPQPQRLLDAKFWRHSHLRAAKCRLSRAGSPAIEVPLEFQFGPDWFCLPPQGIDWEVPGVHSQDKSASAAWSNPQTPSSETLLCDALKL